MIATSTSASGRRRHARAKATEPERAASASQGITEVKPAQQDDGLKSGLAD